MRISDMFEDQLQATNPFFRQAYTEIAGRAETRYYRGDDLNLCRTADTEPWLVPNEVREYLPHIDNVKIDLIEETTDLEVVLSNLTKQRQIGLVLMGPEIGRRKRPSLIILTTESHYWALNPGCQRSVGFLKKCLSDVRLTLWTSNGLHEANSLMEHYGISLRDSRAKDCLGLHLHLMKVLASSANVHSPRGSMYPDRALTHARSSNQNLVSFEKMVFIWLGIDDTNSLESDPSQLAHLAQRPLNLTAKNLIMKRCSLVLRLSEALQSNVQMEQRAMNMNVLCSLASFKDDMALKKMKRKMLEYEETKKPMPVYFAHLENGCNDAY